MKKGMRYLSTILLVGAMSAPLAIAQDRDDHDQNRDRNRVYDRQYKDYHNWTPDEDNAYRQWYTNTYHDREYRDYRKLHRKEQNEYWRYRHEHQDHDHDR